MGLPLTLRGEEASRPSGHARLPSGWSGESRYRWSYTTSALRRDSRSAPGERTTPTRAPPPICSRATWLAQERAPPSELRTAARPGRSHARGTGGARREREARRTGRGAPPGPGARSAPPPAGARRSCAAPAGSARQGAGSRRPPRLARRRRHLARSEPCASRPTGTVGPGVPRRRRAPGRHHRVRLPARDRPRHRLVRQRALPAVQGRRRRHGQGHDPAGIEPSQIADRLEQAGVVEDAGFFQLRARLTGHSGDLRPGSYELRKDMSFTAALDALQRGRAAERGAGRDPRGPLAHGDQAAHQGPPRELRPVPAAARASSTRPTTRRRAARASRASSSRPPTS